MTDQPDLFASVQAKPTVGQLWRNTDPWTSEQSAKELVEEGTLARMLKVTLEALRKYPGLTSKELEAKACFTDGAIRKRLNDLRRLGFAFVDGVKECSITGRKAQVWKPK